jgi:hypothetical protein
MRVLLLLLHLLDSLLLLMLKAAHVAEGGLRSGR